ncbi:unnamed protein product [Brachionus calyciflorus]|uniref:Ubiquitin-like protease family profile domain-containing protein n=1 Tax=Brachionus calyciflorus TaxID=104777 RepID=A0A814C084_9BILA|nr:unnamed protein product [Brachionus calyciflorus]
MIRNRIKFANDYPYLAKKKWKLDNIDHPIQTDGSNCGVYVCRFLEEIINGKKKFIFDNSPGELIRYRQKICYVLKTNSSKNFCSFCGRTISQTDESSLNTLPKRRSSDSKDESENNIENATVVKTRLHSLKQKTEELNNNNLVQKQNRKILIQYLKTPERKSAIFTNEVEMEKENYQDFPAEFNDLDDSQNSTKNQNILHKSFEKVESASRKVFDVVKNSLNNLVEKVVPDKKANILPIEISEQKSHQSFLRSSTPLLNRSQNSEYDLFKVEEEISPISELDSLYFKSEINLLKTKIDDQEQILSDIKDLH